MLLVLTFNCPDGDHISLAMVAVVLFASRGPLTDCIARSCAATSTAGAGLTEHKLLLRHQSLSISADNGVAVV
jgi:hypothetical protein